MIAVHCIGVGLTRVKGGARTSGVAPWVVEHRV